MLVKKCEYIHFIPNCFKIVFVCLFYSSEALSKRHTMEALALDSIPDTNASTTDSAVLPCIGTAMM